MVEALADRPDRLRVLGNGVVPLTAAVAFVTLARRAGLECGVPGLTCDGEAT